MIKKVLIANRGEIAVRIIRACREMGIETVAVYSEADKEALHTQLADEAICIGPAPSSESYLNMEQIISATIVSGADAIHPGFGFLSENTKFAELCEKCNIIFIGPDSKVISRLGNKSEARNTMANAGVPIIPGSREAIYDAAKGKEVAREIGYPVIVKAEAEKECVWRKMKPDLTWHSVLHRKRPRQLLEMTLCTSSILCSIRSTLNFRSWRISMEMWCI